MRKSLFENARSRLVAWNVTVFALLLMLLGILAYRAFSSTVYNDLDKQMRTRATKIQNDLQLKEFAGNATYLFFLQPDLAYSPYRVVVADPSGLIDYNPTQCAQRYPIDPTTGLHFPCPPDSFKPSSQEGVYAALDSGTDLRTDQFKGHGVERVFTFEVTYPRSDAVQYVIQISRDASGQESALHSVRLLLFFGGLLGTILAAAGSLFLANRALVPIRKAFARQRQFTADASHELRTPLALIRANAEMLARHGDRMPDGDSDMVFEIIRETDHLSRMVGDLLTLARADTEALKLSMKEVDFRSLVTEVHEDLHRVAETHGIETTLNLNGPVMLQADETRLRQLLLILLDNALKYTDTGGTVEVSLIRENNHTRLTVQDTGIGIPAKDLPHIFERFYRVDRAREHESGGTGLGLSIARWIVQAHHGNIRVESEQGKGAKFQVDLPVG